MSTNQTTKGISLSDLNSCLLSTHSTSSDLITCDSVSCVSGDMSRDHGLSDSETVPGLGVWENLVRNKTTASPINIRMPSMFLDGPPRRRTASQISSVSETQGSPVSVILIFMSDLHEKYQVAGRYFWA